MNRGASLGFAIVVYAVFLATFCYLIVFVGGFAIAPRTVDAGGTIAPWAIAALIDVALVSIFACQHSVMARPKFKAWWTRFIPSPFERSVYVLCASLALILLFVAWRPMPTVVWNVAGIPAVLLWAVFGLGWAIVLLSTFLINHFELFGLQQAWLHLQGRMAAKPELRQPLLYKLVRHPLYSGFFIAFWATPYMTVGHLVLATTLSVFMLFAITLEERDLVAVFGASYDRYREQVGMLIPRLTRR